LLTREKVKPMNQEYDFAEFVRLYTYWYKIAKMWKRTAYILSVGLVIMTLILIAMTLSNTLGVK
jgi:hypothetical protein